MANNKLHGYQPKMAKEKDGNRLDLYHPHEFRKGMDYELTAIGCSRLAESTVEERESATEKVLKNLDEHGGYYTSLITYETLFRNEIKDIKKPSFKQWLSEQDEIKMQEVKRGDDNSKHKNDKMTEPKKKKTEDSIKADLKVSALKEAIKNQIRKSILEAKDDEEDSEDEEVTDKKATKGAKKAEKGMARFDKEEAAIDELLFGKARGDEEVDEDNPSKGSLLFLKDKHLEVYKKDKDVDKYKDAIALPDVILKKIEKHADIYSKLGNNVKTNDLKGKDLPDTVKKLEARKTEIGKERQEAQSEVGKQRNEIASTDMTRANHLRLLEICSENGVNLREGAEGIRTYYEIAKAAYLEGIAKGWRI